MKRLNLQTLFLASCIIFSTNSFSQSLQLIADYPLIDDLVDASENQTDAFLFGSTPSEPPGNGVELCQDGIWHPKTGFLGTQSLYTPVLKGFDLQNFEVEIEFKPTGFSQPGDATPFKSVITGGHLARWIGIMLDNTGKIGFKYNNQNTNITWTDTILTIDQEYHHGRIVYNNGEAEMYIDEALVHTQTLPPLVDFMHDHEFLTADYSTGAPFYGCVRNLKVRSTTLVYKNDFEG